MNGPHMSWVYMNPKISLWGAISHQKLLRIRFTRFQSGLTGLISISQSSISIWQHCVQSLWSDFSCQKKRNKYRNHNILTSFTSVHPGRHALASSAAESQNGARISKTEDDSHWRRALTEVSSARHVRAAVAAVENKDPFSNFTSPHRSGIVQVL